jgi:hypothetical protein
MTAEGRRAGYSRAKPDEHHARLALRGNRRSEFYADNTTEPGVLIDPERAQRAFEDALEVVRRSYGAPLPSCDRRRARPPARAARGVASASVKDYARRRLRASEERFRANGGMPPAGIEPAHAV